MSMTSWWFQPIWKILVKLDRFPRDEHKNIWNHQLDEYWIATPNMLPSNQHTHHIPKHVVL